MTPSLNRPLDPASGRVQAQLTRGAARLSQIRRHLHRHPELSGQEFSTTDYLSKQLTAARVPHRVATGKCGIITDIIESPDSGAPIVAMRADIDALPIKEENNVPYRSKRSGVMHACGHDAHSAILLGTTLALYRARPLPVAWRSIFQPSEEAGRGACEMVNQGALEGVDAIIALHVDPNLPVGKVAITPGPRTAFCQDFTIEIAGRGGHGARPHTTVDPIADRGAPYHAHLSGRSPANRRAPTCRGHDRHDQCRIRIERDSGHCVTPRHDSNLEHRGGRAGTRNR